MTVPVDRIDRLNPVDAEVGFLRCCGASRWARAMTALRPHQTEDALLRAAEAVASCLRTEDWLEAFSHHPRIGGRVAIDPQRGQGTASWSRGEQSGLDDADGSIRRRIAGLNSAYEARFGHVYLVCATGKTAADLLVMLEERLPHDAPTELAIAAAEQRKITAIRPRKWLNE